MRLAIVVGAALILLASCSRSPDNLDRDTAQSSATTQLSRSSASRTADSITPSVPGSSSTSIASQPLPSPTSGLSRHGLEITIPDGWTIPARTIGRVRVPQFQDGSRTVTAAVHEVFLGPLHRMDRAELELALYDIDARSWLGAMVMNASRFLPVSGDQLVNWRDVDGSAVGGGLVPFGDSTATRFRVTRSLRGLGNEDIEFVEDLYYAACGDVLLRVQMRSAPLYFLQYESTVFATLKERFKCSRSQDPLPLDPLRQQSGLSAPVGDLAPAGMGVRVQGAEAFLKEPPQRIDYAEAGERYGEFISKSPDFDQKGLASLIEAAKLGMPPAQAALAHLLRPTQPDTAYFWARIATELTELRLWEREGFTIQGWAGTGAGELPVLLRQLRAAVPVERLRIIELEAGIWVRQHEGIWLKSELAKRERAREASPDVKRADEAIAALLKFGIAGVMCSAKGELVDCPLTVQSLPAVPAAECKAYLQQLGHADPCRAMVSPVK